ncbi:hypothetical protein [Pandoraea fibrosis]|uniref:Uncharacterized protein n=1 Tax=Pandoraea fibrosis TaxID=1891094 RepID=A0A5E4RHX5_9BURK|nr:hypothetical protein [Pandoraea fibrosis]VVD62092.1 hypothetical protein PFI31113_00161 [Pandoraea fibrosis]
MKSQRLELIAGAALSLAALMLALPSQAAETSKGTLHLHGEQVTTGCVAHMLNSDYEFSTVAGSPATEILTGDLLTNPTVPTAAHVQISCETQATISAVKLIAASNLDIDDINWYAPGSDRTVQIEVQAPLDGWDPKKNDSWHTPLANGRQPVPGEVNVLAEGDTISIAAHASYQNYVPVIVFVSEKASPGDYVMGVTYAITY